MNETSSAYVVVAALAIAIASYVAVKIGLSRLADKLGIELPAFFTGVSALSAFTIFLSITSIVFNLLPLFTLTIVILVFILVGFLIAVRHVLEEYFAGTLSSKIYGIHVGDYIRLGRVAGYITAMKPTSLVVRDMRRNLVYIPYTKLLHEVFRVVKIEEGYELRVYIYVPHGTDISKLRDELATVAAEYGIEGFRIDLEHIGFRGAVLAARGILRDPRREEEARFALLDKAYSVLTAGGLK
ncbi:mechanosensitive ion channel domain-containing protein [Thermoproteus tenax]|uniref:Mechanosensitive ion channel n=1 Tax=Thermoproteus tenax (strain ATCC 35583 / DSM 2078 / JCM 9277 / NBRC 100435 / Kra 1) TaxID=768679 RepID=G4RKY3_THETK|nr:mechanosensitive ion channel domain-containing protein [Thermoproteus tenax]CCC82228.1 mechanosensitive ion channel [Thermoproteus tenax Kra 1]